MTLNASSGTCIIIAAVRLTLSVELRANEVWYCLRVLGDVGRNAVRTDAVVTEAGRVTVVGICASRIAFRLQADQGALGNLRSTPLISGTDRHGLRAPISMYEDEE